MKYSEIIQQMTLEDKVAFCSGADYWTTKAFEQYGIPSIRMTDGPHGLRKKIEGSDEMDINDSVPATSFPTASLSACSWDRNLLREMGEAIGEEALQEGVSIVLGPGVNIKRNPLCGRNFEYFSEDPYLSGEMAVSWIKGVQAKDVGTSIKHFAANSQETERMSSDSIIDERTLRELYLPSFEKAVKSAQPTTVMCAYNKLNGTYCSENDYLLRNILREEWGFRGINITDWGAMNDRSKGFEAGMDLEMPGSNGRFDEQVIAAVREGELAEKYIDECVERLLDMVFKFAASSKLDYRYDVEAHHQLAKKIAVNSAVLLKNEANILPITDEKKIALIGALAKTPRYQGAGSSHINPTRLLSVVEGCDSLALDYAYFDGYLLNGDADEALLKEAVAGAENCDVVVIVAGLPAIYESEAYDRETMAMPESHNELISRVADANSNTVVVLVGGAPVEMPWLSKVKAVLNLYLAGQAGGLAALELITGRVNPSGKLAESYPLSYSDVPSSGLYETGRKQAQYREGIYVGYRYYDKAEKDVLFPFGHGLSYTSFTYSDLEISSADLDDPYELALSFLIRNTGAVDGAAVPQVYVCPVDSPVFRPAKELKEFTKVALRAGESRRVSFTLDGRAFAIFDEKDWVVPGGTYTILIGASSRDIRLQGEVNIRGVEVYPNEESDASWYSQPIGKPSQEDFESLLGRKIEPVKIPRKGEYTLSCSFDDMKDQFIIRQFLKIIENTIARRLSGADGTDPAFKMIMHSARYTPLKNVILTSSESMSRHTAQGLVHLANGKYLKAIRSLLQI